VLRNVIFDKISKKLHEKGLITWQKHCFYWVIKPFLHVKQYAFTVQTQR